MTGLSAVPVQLCAILAEGLAARARDTIVRWNFASRAAQRVVVMDALFLRVPSRMLSEASYTDLADQFELFLRRAKWRVSKNDEAAN